MATGTFVWYGPCLLRMANKEIDLDGDTLKAALANSSYSPNRDTHGVWADVSANQVTGTGWAGPVTLTGVTVNLDTASHRLRMFFDDISVAGVTLSDGKHLVIFDDTHASKALIGYVTFDVALAPSAGPLVIDFDVVNAVGRIAY